MINIVHQAISATKLFVYANGPLSLMETHLILFVGNMLDGFADGDPQL